MKVTSKYNKMNTICKYNNYECDLQVKHWWIWFPSVTMLMNIVLIKRRKTHAVLSMTKLTEPWISEEQPEIFFLLCLNFQLLTPCIITCCAIGCSIGGGIGCGIWLVLVIILVNIIGVIHQLCLIIIMSFFFLFLIIIISFFLPFLVIVMYFFTITGCFYFPPLVLMSDKSILIFPCSWQKTVSGKEKHTCQMILLGKSRPGSVEVS